MDSVNEPLVEEIILMWASQLCKTEIQINVIGYFVHQDPSPILKIDPSLEMAENFSKTRLSPTIRDTPVLAQRIADPKARDSGNTILMKNFPGGYLAMCGSNSPAGLASRPIRVVLPDEIDRFEVSAGSEGNPVDLARRRQNNYFNRKTLIVSTPTVKDASPIEARYLESDQRKFFVPCPHCGKDQALIWSQVKWPEGKPRKAYYECEHCEQSISTAQKNRAIAQGRWKPTATPKPGCERVRGFWLWGIYSPWLSIGDIAEQYVRVRKDPQRLKTFVNTVLCQTWEEPGAEQLEWQQLKTRAEMYSQKFVPAGGLVLTAGVDVQSNRLAVSIWAWGEGEESWLILWEEIPGDPMQDEVWQQLDQVLMAKYPHESGIELTVSSAAIDSGYLPQRTYNFVRTRRGRRLMAVKGSSQAGKPIVGRPSSQEVTHKGERLKRGVQLWPVGTDVIKGTLYCRLRLTIAGPGYVHFPGDLPDDFYQQICAEKLVTRWIKGFPHKEWRKIQPRNEALDTAVYAFAAANVVGVSRMNWKKFRADLFPKQKDQPDPEQDNREPDPPPKTRRDRERRNWTTTW